MRTRLASSKPRNVAPFANGDLRSAYCQSIYAFMIAFEGAYRMRVGVSPRVNAGRPSVRHTVLTQSRVDLYFCPSAAEKPSVCMRDFIMSMGYMTAQS